MISSSSRHTWKTRRRSFLRTLHGVGHRLARAAFPRRFTRTLMSDKALLVKARMMPLYDAPSGRLYTQLVDLFTFYQYFEIGNLERGPVRRGRRLSALRSSAAVPAFGVQAHSKAQRISPSGNCAGVERRKNLVQHLSVLEPEEFTGSSPGNSDCAIRTIRGRRIRSFCSRSW